MYRLSISLTIFCKFAIAAAPYEDAPCLHGNSEENGKCVDITQCPSANILLKQGEVPQICGFLGLVPKVCCFENSTHAAIVGYKSYTYCIKHFGKFRLSAVGGTKARSQEFPHMALVGYGDENDIQWLCGGSLISEQFVLSAAHCRYSKQFGYPKWIRLGDLDIVETTDDADPHNFAIAEIFVHPGYKPPIHYNDIALFKLEENVKFSRYIEPACLPINKLFDDQTLLATGWGKTGFTEERSNHLIKVDLKLVPGEQCKSFFSNSIKLPSGILNETQICAGNPGKDTCEGDSGGPLQAQVHHYYEVIGITSFGKACGISASPGVYSRVSSYLNWIEDIVWPN